MQGLVEVEAAYQTFLSHVYKEASAEGVNSRSEIEVYQTQHICHTFGELLTPSLMALLKILPLTPQDVFLDLGSGMGKLALTVYLRTCLQHVIGVEGSNAYFAQGIQVIQNLRQHIPDLFSKGKLDLIHGNFLDFDFKQATIIYTCSTCFTQELLWLIGDKINQATNVNHVLSLKPIANIESLSLKKVIPVECSWDSALCYYYG
jgi:SAM-dependent methyltransferase